MRFCKNIRCSRTFYKYFLLQEDVSDFFLSPSLLLHCHANRWLCSHSKNLNLKFSHSSAPPLLLSCYFFHSQSAKKINLFGESVFRSKMKKWNVEPFSVTVWRYPNSFTVKTKRSRIFQTHTYTHMRARRAQFFLSSLSSQYQFTVVPDAPKKRHLTFNGMILVFFLCSYTHLNINIQK